MLIAVAAVRVISNEAAAGEICLTKSNFWDESLIMLKNGQYNVWFKARQGEGVGIITLENGSISGRDALVTYSGSYKEDGDRFSAIIHTKRHSPGRLPLFQIDELDIELEGTSETRIATARGRIAQVLDTFFEVTLIPVPDEPVLVDRSL